MPPAGAAPDAEQLRAELAHAKATLEGMERFVYLCSHDLREPLRMITGFMGLLQRRSQGMTPSQLEYLELSLSGALRLDAMLDALLRFSRLGRTHQPAACGLTALVADLQGRLGAARNLPATTWTTSGALPEVWADPQQLAVLLQELLTNAVTFTRPEAAPEVAISAARHGSCWRLSIADRGSGVAAGDRIRAFEVFSRLGNAVPDQGTGIGLALCAKVVARHHGRIWLEDNPPDKAHPAGGGTVVVVELPDAVVA